MSNVFTKKNTWPKTVTLYDFTVPIKSSNVKLRRPERLLSPTRTQCPHPPGLVIQPPYNRHDSTFVCWVPSDDKRESRMPEMLEHIVETNFTNGPFKLPDISTERKIPQIKFSTETSYRQHFCKPEIPSAFHYMFTPGRTKYRPYELAIGIAPSVLTPPRTEDHNSPDAEETT